MKEEITTKLYYGRYAYIVILDHKYGNIEKVTKWLKKQDIDFKLRSKGKRSPLHTYWYYSINKNRKVYTKIFVRGQEDFDKICAKYKSLVYGVTKPQNEQHEEILNNLMNVIYQDKLLYNKYSYVVNFKGAYESNDVGRWVNQFVKDAPAENLRKIQRNLYTWNPSSRLYLSAEEDVVLVKLTWSDKIKSITHIQTFDALKALPVGEEPVEEESTIESDSSIQPDDDQQNSLT